MFDEETVWEYFRLYLKKQIGYKQLSESFIVAFVQSFRRDSNMSTDRLDIGITLLQEVITIQTIRNNKAGPLN